MDHDSPRAPIELTREDLAYCQLRARTARVTVHFTNWPGTPSVPVTVLPAGCEDGNIRLPNGRPLFAMPDELSTIPRDGLEVRDVPAADPGRVFTTSRLAQFADQAHLDRWYAYYDHVEECRNSGTPDRCGQPGTGMETTDGGWQPSETRCPAARRLLQAV